VTNVQDDVLVRVAIDAMATRFELVIVDDEGDAVRARAIAEEALAEIARLEDRLSLFRPSSDVAAINAAASERPVRVEPTLFSLLQRCLELSAACDGAFDITVGPLTRLWKGATAVPPAAAIEDARRRAGWQHLILDDERSTIGFARAGMTIDLGAAGKGYAIDRAIDVLRLHGVARALLHGGTSSVHALGAPRGEAAWRVGWSGDTGGKVFELRDGALSVSAVHGRMFSSGGRDYGHVIDPRTGWPTQNTRSAAVTGPASFECDVLSTALLVQGADWLPTLRARFPGYDGRINPR
jgi:thiamine biosynthesis lipoprotein